MWSYSKYYLFILLLWNAQSALGQAEHFTVDGVVVDEHTHEHIPYATVYIEELARGAVTDEAGYFSLSELGAGSYHLRIRHVGCEPAQVFLDLRQDTTLHIHLDHSHHVLQDITVLEEGGPVTLQESVHINASHIETAGAQSLADIAAQMTGVSALRNGAGIAKPIVQGLTGNRVSILQSGIVQAGQQWGNDHSPEIDPWMAREITVIKGVSSVQYPGSTVGAVLLVEPGDIPDEPHLHGSASYRYATNGRLHAANIKLEQQAGGLGYRWIASAKRAGDYSTPDYYLNNTGHSELNSSLQLQKKIGVWDAELYISTFNTSLGVLRGAHISNLTDLELAIGRDVPYYTDPDFSYAIDPPRQEVHHHFFKASVERKLDERRRLSYTYAAQWNLRSEYDIRRSGRSDIPALQLDQWQHSLQGRYDQYLSGDQRIKMGVDLNFIDNNNSPGTGILPLIPNYISAGAAAFVLYTQPLSDHWTTELGGRLDYEYQEVKAIERGPPTEVVRYENNNTRYALTGGLAWTASPDMTLRYNIGWAGRSPAINERYSQGLHQGVGGIEEGAIDLVNERSVKNSLSLEAHIGERVIAKVLGYHQSIRDFIYLRPESDLRLTIRGAFPVFTYSQTDARLLGADVSVGFELADPLQLELGYSYIQGQNMTEDLPLLQIPPAQLKARLEYELRDAMGLERFLIAVVPEYVFSPRALAEGQDFLAVPEDYFLLGLRARAERSLGPYRMRLYLSAENMLNVSYRNYLNRLRYFADEPGRNFKMGITFIF